MGWVSFLSKSGSILVSAEAINAHLDSSTQGIYFHGEILRFMFDFLIAQDEKVYNLVCFAIMPNHVHLLIKPNDNLSSVMQKIKGASARGVNKMLKKRGTFWASDYYDKAIRDEKHFRVVYEYIRNNPLKIDIGNGATKVALPNQENSGSEALASPNAGTRFYGIYDDV